MSSKRLIAARGARSCAALAAAGVAAAPPSGERPVGDRRRSTRPTVSHAAPDDVHGQRRRHVRGDARPRTAERRRAATPASNGAITIRAQSLVDTTTGVGRVVGDFRIRSAERPGRTRTRSNAVARQRRGRPERRRRRLTPGRPAGGELFARPRRRLRPRAAASRRRQRSEPAAARARASCSSTAACSGARIYLHWLHRHARRQHGTEVEGRRCRSGAPLVALRRRVEDHERRRRRRVITPFIVKKAVSSRRRSPGRTSECS